VCLLHVDCRLTGRIIGEKGTIKFMDAVENALGISLAELKGLTLLGMEVPTRTQDNMERCPPGTRILVAFGFLSMKYMLRLGTRMEFGPL
jgi:hypothetical protein